MRIDRRGVLVGLVVAVLVVAAALVLVRRRPSNGLDRPEQRPLERGPGGEVGLAMVELRPLGTSRVVGRITLAKLEDGSAIRVLSRVRNLAPGSHGLSIREAEDCNALTDPSTGGHFNPAGKAHGEPQEEESHAGDLGNLFAGVHGRARGTVITRKISLDRGARGVLGRVVAVDERADDATKQPSGDSGAPVACGVIRPS